MYRKEEIRKIIQTYRKALSRDDAVMKSIAILDKVIKMDAYRTASCVYCYIDFKNEVMTKPLIKRAWADGKRVAVPRIEEGGMEFYYINSYEELEPGTMGILEPKKECAVAREMDALVIMPGLAFDRKKHRIGYGGGYYDRYFDKKNSHYKIALAYEFQIFEAFSYEMHDVSPDIIVTEASP